MRITSGGRVGIGTTSPAGKLSVIGDVIIGQYSDSVTNNLDIRTNKALFTISPDGVTNGNGTIISYSWANGGQGPLRFNNASGEVMRLSSSGNVGIGTTSPAEKLSVSGAIISTGAITGHGANRTSLSQEGSNGAYWQSYGADASTVGTFNLRQATSDFSTNRIALHINSGGNVGIGTTSPAYKLEIAGTTDGVIGIRNTTNNSFRGLAFLDGTGSTEYAYIKYNANTGEMRHWTNPTAFGGFTSFYSNNAESMRITSGGNVGIGTTSPSAKLDVRTGAVGTLVNFTDGIAQTFQVGTTASGIDISNPNSGYISFSNTAERMRITSGGNVLLGTTDTGFNARQLIRFDASGASTNGLAIWNGGGSGATYVAFANSGGGFTGTITQTASGVAYNTTSDYRLKEDLKEIKGLEKISKIKVYDFKWKDDNSRMDGVIAHELQEVVPYAVTGEKDAEEMQQVDYSKLVPILVQAIQEQNEILEQLKQEIEILKNK